jgi:hypothetical protein
MDNLKTLFVLPPGEKELTTRQTLTLIGLAALTALLIGAIPIVNLLNYPFRLLITIVHELGHGLAALLTGGEFHSFVITPNGSGLAYTGGGWRLVVIPAGYLGVALFTALLIRVGRSHRWSRVALGVIGAAMILLSLFFGRPGQLSIEAIVYSVLTVMMGAIFGALFVKLALQASPGGIIFFLHFIAIKAGFAAFSDIFAVIGLSTRLGQVPKTDAHAMAEVTHIPAFFWGVVWVVMAFVIISGAVWMTWFREDGKTRRVEGVDWSER